MRKKLFAILPTLCVLLCVLALGVSAATTISTADDFVTIMSSSANWSGEYELGDDLDLTAVTLPTIGTKDVPFSGSFDGSGHTVKVSINASTDYVGLFSYVGGATIKNLTVEGTVTSSGKNVGGIIGVVFIDDASSAFTIENCNNKAVVTGASSVGGIIGRIEVRNGNTASHTIASCANYNTVSDTSGGIIGGIVGIASNGTSSTSGATATITLDNCYNKGNVISANSNAGGIVGYFRVYGNTTDATKSYLTNCMNAGDVSCAVAVESQSGVGTGGIIGYGNIGSKAYTISDCYNCGKITATDGGIRIGAIAAYHGANAVISNTYYLDNGETYANTAANYGTKVTEETYGDTSVVSLDDTYWAITNEGPVLEQFLELDGTIGSKEELILLMNTPTAWDADYTLACNIDLTGETLSPIGNATTPFTGSFDGEGYTISGLSLTNRTEAYVGLFGYVKDAAISNLTVSGEVSNTGDGIGIGGIIGYAYNGVTVTNCINKVAVNGTASATNSGVGGVIGFVHTDKNISATTNIDITKCKNYANVTGTKSVGGIVGRFLSDTNVNGKDYSVTECANYGEVSDVSGGMVGGIIGITSHGAKNSTFTIDNCYNNGKVTSAGAHVGGIVGYYRIWVTNTSSVGVLKNSMNAGDVSYTGTLTTGCGTGGIIGYGNGSAGIYTITNCYNCGSVKSANGKRVGAIAAAHSTNASLVVSDTYYLDIGETYDPVNSADTQIKVTAAECGDAATFDGFAEEYWVFAGDGPMLRSFFELDTVIGSEEELLLLMEATDKWNLAYTLACDLDMTGKIVTPIGNSTTAFTGSFDGKNHKISGLDITGTETGTGFFGIVSGNVEIKNLTVEGNVESAKAWVGGIVGLFKTSDGASLIIENCTNNCTVSTDAAYTGGIVGYVEGSATDVTLNITGCTNNGSITAGGNVAGGILGYYANKNQTAATPDTVTVTKCKNTGAIDSLEFAGGIVGAMFSSNNNYYANVTLTELYNANQSRIVEVPANRGTIIGFIRSLAGGGYTISDLHDRAEPIHKVENGYFVYEQDETYDLYYTKDGSVFYSDNTGATEVAVDVSELDPVWSNGCAPIGNITGFSETNKLTVTRVVGEMALFVAPGTVIDYIDASYYTCGYADHIEASRPYAYTDVIFNDREVNGEDNKWVMTWSGPMLKEFAENEISNIVYGTKTEYDDRYGDNADHGDNVHTLSSAKLTISNAADFINLMNCHRLWDLDVTLGTSIDLSGYETSNKQYYNGYTDYGNAKIGGNLKQMPIGRSLEKKFSGTFDGAGYTISGLDITYDETHGSGLFGTVEGRIVGTEKDADGNDRNIRTPVVIKDLTVKGTVTNAKQSRSGGIVGQVLAPLQIIDCQSYVAVNVPTGAGGGILGTYAAYNGSYVDILNCDNYGEINGEAYLGGIVGYLVTAGIDAPTPDISEKLTITDCTNYGYVEGTSGGIGGILGTVSMSSYQSNDGGNGEGFVKITNSVNKAEVKGRFYVGGIFGYINKLVRYNPINMSYEITECTNEANVTAYGDTDGEIKSGGSAAAGIVGFVRLASNNDFTVDSCTNSGNVSGVGRSGGIVGYIHNYDTISTDEVIEDAEGDGSIGDDVGSEGDDSTDSGNTPTEEKSYTSNVTYIITKCTNTGSVTVDGNTIVGGILGYYANMGYPDMVYANGEPNKLIISYCKNEGDVDALTTSNAEKGKYVGGIVGAIGSNVNYSCHAEITIDTVYNAGNVGENATDFIGTIVGTVRPLMTGSVEVDGAPVICNSSYNIIDAHGGVSAAPAIGAFGHYSVGGAAVFDYTRVYAEYYNDLVGIYNGHTITINNCITDANNALQLREFVDNSEGKWVMTYEGPMLTYFAGDKETVTDYTYTVANANDLIKLMNSPALWSADVTLASDIDLTGVAGQAPIGNSHIAFIGTFNGGGNKISGLNLTGADNIGLFGYVEGYGKDDSYVGAKISNLTVYGTVSSTARAETTSTIGTGGIIGKAYGVQLTNCINNVEVNGVNCVGGIAGLVNVGGLQIYPLTETDNMMYSQMPTYSAGTTNVENCKNEAAITASGEYVGGLVGLVYSVNKDAVVNIINNENSGSVSADRMAGGLVGRLDNRADGENNKYTIEKFKNTGNITVVNGYAGGLAGILSLGSGTSAYGATVTVDTVLNGSNLHDIDAAAGTIASTGSYGRYVGGIVGLSRNYGSNEEALQYSNLMNTGAVLSACVLTEDTEINGETVLAGGAVGGIFGTANHGSGLYVAENLYNRGAVTTETNIAIGAITAASGVAMGNGYVKDLYAYNANADSFDYVGGVNFVDEDMLGYSEAFTQTPSGKSYLMAYSNGLAPFETEYTKTAELPATYENWIMTSEGAELSYYHVHDSVAADGTITCICIPEERKAISFRVALLSEYLLEYTIPYNAGETNPRMVYTITDANGNITTTVVEPVTYETSGANNESDFAVMYPGSGTSKYYFKAPDIAGKEMTDKITGTFYYGEGEDMCKSNTVSGNLITYYQVAKSVWGSRTDDTAVKLMTLLDAMVNYGAAAQEYFGYGADNLATDAAGAPKVDYTTTDVTINEEDAIMTRTEIEGQKYTFALQSADLDQRISSILYFEYTDMPDLENLVFKGSYTNVTGALITFTADTVKIETIEGTEYIAVYVDRPAAKDLRVEFTGALYEGETQVSDKVTTSFECYALLAEGTSDNSLKALCRSILAYCDVAKDYFDAYWNEILESTEQ